MQTLYRYHIPGDYLLDPYDVLYIAKGDAISRRSTYNDAQRVLRQLIEEKTLYDGDLNEIAKNAGTMTRYITTYPTKRATEWCIDANTAKARAVELGFDMEESYPMSADLSIRGVFPVTVPFTTTLYANSRGLYCEIDMHPEETGGWRRKYYFPDRSCKDKLVPGEMIVTKVIDRGNYGFVVGTMKQYSRPDEEQLAEFFAGDSTYWNFGILNFLNTPHGKLTQVVNNTRNKHTGKVDHQESWIALPDEDDHPKFKRDYYLNGLVEDEINNGTATVEETISVAEFLCQGYQGCTLAELGQRFKDIPFDTAGSYRTVKFRTDLYDEAVKYGIFTSRAFTFNVDYIEVNEDHMLELAVDFKPDEVNTLVELVNRVNEQATTAMRNKIRKGKIAIM